MDADREGSASGERAKASRSAMVAVLAGGNLIAIPAVFGVWLLRRTDIILGPRYWVYSLIILGSVVVDICGRAFLQQRPGSRIRQQLRVVVAVSVVTTIVYASGWGSLLAIAYALCAVQMLAQIPGIDWRTVLGWCLVSAFAGEIAIQIGVAPHMAGAFDSHLMAAVGLGLLAATLWVVSGTFAARDAIEQEVRVRGERHEHEAATDSLTQLLNRGAFTEALEQSCARGEPAILAFVDLDNFKDINDSFGHHMGDEVLVEVAKRLRRVVRAGDLIARYGGDEFVILVRSSHEETDAAELVDRIWGVLAEPWPDIAPNTVSASVGVVDDTDGSRSPEALLREADTAMYARKHGISPTGTMATMTSRALAHHRIAMDGMGGAFAVLRAVREDGDIVDFVVVEANATVRASLTSTRGEILGARLSALNVREDSDAFIRLYKNVLETGRPVEEERPVSVRSGGRGWRRVNVITVDRDVVAVVAFDVTREVQGRESLERERARFASLVARTSDLACIVDTEGEIVYRPTPDARFLGYSGEALGAPLTKVVAADRAPAGAWFNEMRTSAPGFEGRAVALRFEASDGRVHTCDVTAENRMLEPAIAGIVLNVHDISAVVAAEARLAAVADAVTDIITICDSNAGIMWVSGAVRDVLGREPDELVGVSAFDVVHPDDRDAIAARLARLVTETGPNTAAPLEIRLRRVDGSYRWFESTATNQFADPSIRGLVISLRDITERRASEAALRLSEERNRNIVEAADDAVISVDTVGVIQSFNRAAERIFAIRAADVIGQPYSRFLSSDSVLIERNRPGDRVGRQVDTTLTRATGETFAAHVAISDVQVGTTHYYTAMVRDISEQRAMEHALRLAATCDELTGLPNRRTLLDRAGAAILDARRSNEIVGMVFVDLDRFKLLNDGLGHDAGDQLLVLVADRIAGAIRVGDIVARMGSDEFVILCPSASDLDAVRAVALRVVDALAASFVVGESEVFVGASLGISVSSGDDTPLELLRCADTAMYRAKEHGDTRIEVFNAEMESDAARRLELESALRQAARKDELVAHYQPIVDLEDERVSHLEALIRWHRPGVGMVPPDSFIPVAEESGIIMEIGPWVLRRAVADCLTWQQIAPGVGVAVNVSVRQFESGDLVQTVYEALAESGLAADLLILEITESVMLEHTDRNAAIMRRIRDLGVHISLDDFGSGYSSLTYLRRLPIDSIKIDRSFLQTLGSAARDDAILSAIVKLGSASDLDVIAEGIDTDAKLAAVRAVGCHYGQGFLFAKGMGIEDTLIYLIGKQRTATPVD